MDDRLMNGAGAYYGDAFVMQGVFRETMNALAHPYKVYNIFAGADVAGTGGFAPGAPTRGADAAGNGISGADAAAMLLCSVFLDNTVSLYAHENDEFASRIKELTYVRLAGPEEADFIVDTRGGFDMWERVNPGTLADPHKGATVIIAVPQINGGVAVAAEGPGIDGKKTFYISREIAGCVFRAAGLEIEYPKGFELIFLDPRGGVCAVPRHVKTHGGAA